MRPVPVSTRLMAARYAPRDVEGGLGLLVDRHQDVGGQRLDDVPGGQGVGGVVCMAAELAASGGVALARRSRSAVGQGTEHLGVPLRVRAELPVGDLLGQRGGGQLDLAGLAGSRSVDSAVDDLLRPAPPGRRPPPAGVGRTRRRAPWWCWAARTWWWS